MSEANGTEDAEFFRELLREFVEEASHMLEECEEAYLKLEDPSCREEQLACIFRVAHSLKGTGAAVGVKDLAQFAHAVEDLLSLLRADPSKFGSDVVSLLLRCGDALKEKIRMLKVGSQEPWDTSALREEVLRCAESLRGAGDGPKASNVPQNVPNSPISQSEDWTEDLAETTRQQMPTKEHASMVKVDADRIDHVLDLVGELVVIKSQLMMRAGSYAQDQGLGQVVSLLDKTVREIQDGTLGMRMTPLKSLFLKCQRVIRDVALKLSKPVEVVFSGEDTELDRLMVEMISDPLLHLVRNAVDHGVEPAEQRAQAGKASKAVIQLSACHSGGRVVVKIQDDGGGINREKVLAKAVKSGLIAPETNLEAIPDSQVFSLIFAPGFSTAEMISDISGRGVGLDVVRNNIEKLRGSVEVRSQQGAGSTFIISLPLTTSITDGMVTEVGQHRYIVPMESIQDLMESRVSQVTELADGDRLLRTRNGMIPLIRLADYVGQPNSDHPQRMVIVVQDGNKGLGIEVDRVIGQAQVVLKPLGEGLKEIPGLAGAAVLGDGGVGLVLDVENIGRSIRAAS